MFFLPFLRRWRVVQAIRIKRKTTRFNRLARRTGRHMRGQWEEEEEDEEGVGRREEGGRRRRRMRRE